MRKLKEPITLAEKARYYREQANRSLKRQEELAHIWNTKGGTEFRDKLRAEEKFFGKMILEAKSHEQMIYLINQ